MANYVSRIRAEFDARQATEAMYALSERARYLNKLLEAQRKRWEEASDDKVRDSIESNMKRLEAEVAAVEKLNKTIEKSITTESAFQQVLNGKEGSLSIARLESAQRNARAIMRNINPQDENAIDQMDEANRVMNEAGKRLASLKNGFSDAMGTVQDGVEGMAIPELKRLEAALTEAQKFSVDQQEWDRYAEAIGKVRLEMQSASIASVQMDEANAKVAASLKNGFEDAFATFSNGIDDMALPELKRLEAALTETQKFSVDAEEWQKYGSAIDEVKIKIQGITGEYLSVEKAMSYAGQIEKQTFTGTIADLEQAKKLLTDYRKTIAQTGKGADELLKIGKNLEIIEDQIKGVYLTTEKFNEILSNPKGKSFDELKQAVERAEKQLYGMRRETDEEREAFAKLHSQIEGAKVEMKNFGDAQEDTGKGMEELISQAKRLAGAYIGLQSFQKVWQDNLDLSDQMAAVRKTTGMTAEAVADLSEKVMAIDSRAAIDQLMALSATAGQLGLSASEDVIGFTKAANQITVSLDELGTDGVLNLMKVAQVSGALDQEMGDVETTLLKVGSSINELSAASSATAGPITDFIARVGGVASTAKMAMSEIAALGATTDALAISAELAGTQTNIFIGGMQKNTKAVADLLGVSKEYVQEMMDNGQAMNVFVEVMEKLGNLNANQLDDFLKQMGSSGSRATQVFSTLSKNVDQLRANLEVSNEAYKEGISITDEYNKVNDTAAGKWERLKNKIQEFFITADNTSWLSSTIDGLRTLVDLLTEEGPIGRFFRFTLVYLVLLKAKWAETLGTMIMSVGKYILSLKASTAATTADTAAKTANAAATKAVGNATEEAAVKTGLFSKAWGKLDKAMKANVIIAVATAVLYLGSMLIDVAKKSKETAKRLDQVADAERRAKEESVKQRAELERLYKATQDQTKSLEERKKALHDMVGDERYKQYYEGLANESELAKAAAKEYSNLTTEIIKSAKARAYQQKITELAEKNVELEDKIEEGQKYVSKNAAGYKRVSTNLAKTPSAAGIFGTTAAAAESHNDARRQFMREYEAKQQDIITNQEEMKKNDEDILKLETKIKKLNLPPKTGIVEDEGDGGSGGGGGGGRQAPSKETTSYKDMSPDELVERKKKMKENVGGLGTEADVKRLIKEDEDLAAAFKGRVASMKEVVDWYNQERLKIQSELDSRHLTNSGDWKDPKQEKARRKRLQDDMKAYLEELDAYYTERKTKIQQAGNEEGLSDAEIRNRTIANETEWYQRRAELQQMYSEKATQVTKEEQDAILAIIADRTEDDVKYIKATIDKTVAFSKAIRDANEQGAKEYRKFQGDLDIGSQRDFNKVQMTIREQMKAIQDIIDKERPFNGITKNLRENLVTMDILTADMRKKYRQLMKEGKDTSDFDRRQKEEEVKRTTFLLGEAEHAYSSTVEEVMARMGKAGMEAWAEEIRQSPKMQEALMAQLHQTYDAIQEAIKKEASLMKKQAETMWNNILLPGGDGKTTVKDAFEQTIAQLGVDQGRVSRANSMIGAGTQSERVADKLAIKQMQLQLTMQQHYYNLIEKQGRQRIKDLERSIELAKELGDVEKQKRLEQDKQHLEMSLNLAMTKEQTDILKQQEEIIARTEESQARLYKQLKEWGELIASSLQSVFEASNAGNAEYYNELAKMNLTGKGGPGAGTYVVIDNAGTEDAEAHYEYLDQRAALERQHEIEQENAQAEAWKKVMDDINMKMSDQITDWLNASLQQQALDTNTNALGENTKAIYAMIGAMGGSTDVNVDISGVGGFPKVDSNNPDTWGYAARKRGGMNTNDAGGTDEMPTPSAGEAPASGTPMMQFPTTPEQVENIKANMEEVFGTYRDLSVQAETEKAEMLAEIPNFTKSPISITDEDLESLSEKLEVMNQMEIDKSDEKTAKLLDNQKKVQQGELNSEKQMSQSSKNMYASMIAAANLYGVAYQTVTNDNLSASQKFEMIALQAAGQSAIAMLQTKMFKSEGDVLVSLPELLADCLNISPIGGAAIFAVLSALLGAAIGTAVSNMNKKKSEIAQVTGASASAGRLSTGMLTYAEGNVNEFTDPGSLTPGRQYNVDGADGRTYRARYMGSNPRTHLTNGPEFHLAGERGREMIIDAGTTRQITMNEGEIWHAIQTLSAGGRMVSTRRRGRGVRAFADGNVEDFEEVSSVMGDGMTDTGIGGFSPEMAAQMQASLDRNSEVMERVLEQGIHAYFDVYGKDGVVHVYDSAKKTLSRHGERY